jgi:hypothetical protein
MCETESKTNDNAYHFSSEHYTSTIMRTMAVVIGIIVGCHLLRQLLQLIRDTRTARLAKCFIYEQYKVGVSLKFTAFFYNVTHRQTFNEY